MFNFLVNTILNKKELICQERTCSARPCPSCGARFSVYKNHVGFQLGVPIYCSMECYLSQNPNPYET